MADAAGNVIKLPGHSTKNVYTPVELLASNAKLVQQGCTLAGNQGLLAVGTVLGKVTATGKYIAYVSSAGDGSQTPVGVLRTEVDTGLTSAGTAADILGNIVKGGVLDATVMVGWTGSAFTASTSTAGSFDSTAQTALKARLDAATNQLFF